MVYHAPKQKAGLDLEGMEGELVAWVDQYKGKVLSTSLPAKIKFIMEVDGKDKPFFAHLVRRVNLHLAVLSACSRCLDYHLRLHRIACGCGQYMLPDCWAMWQSPRHENHR